MNNSTIYITLGVGVFFSLIITSLIIYFMFSSPPTTELEPLTTPSTTASTTTPTTTASTTTPSTTASTTPSTTTPAPLKWSPPSNMGRDDCFDYGRYWFAAGKPPYCDVYKRVDGRFLPKCDIHPSQRKTSSLRFNWDNNKTKRWNTDNQAKICTDNNKCFDAKSGSAWCYEPNQ